MIPAQMEMDVAQSGAILRPTLLTSKSVVERAEKDEQLLPEESSSDSEQEAKDPTKDYVYFGIDMKPVLFVVLVVSTILGAIGMFLVHVPMLEHYGLASRVHLSSCFVPVYLVTLSCMMFCAWADPGQITKANKVDGNDLEKGIVMPRRAHKTWQYSLPVRRYDHYCRFVRNTIGLKNHREFFIMIIGLALIAVVGVVVDLCLAAMMAFRQEAGLQSSVLVGLHFAYSVALLATDIPIVRIHVGLICRNELGKEWRRRSHYIANGTSKGDNVLPDDMSVDEFNDFLDRDAFEYVPERNPWDNGLLENCAAFWCEPRWSSDTTGEF